MATQQNQKFLIDKNTPCFKGTTMDLKQLFVNRIHKENTIEICEISLFDIETTANVSSPKLKTKHLGSKQVLKIQSLRYTTPRRSYF